MTVSLFFFVFVFFVSLLFFFFNDPATTEIYTLSLHDALPIFLGDAEHLAQSDDREPVLLAAPDAPLLDPASHRHSRHPEKLCRISHRHEVVEADVALIAEPGSVAHDRDSGANGPIGLVGRSRVREVPAADMGGTGGLHPYRRFIPGISAEAAPIWVDPEALHEVMAPRHMCS